LTGKPLVIVLGATAVGKTDLAIQLAQRFNGEIVGADSRQIYRTMDIGTAKPTVTQQGQVKHHLIDVVNPHETLSLAQYQRLALEAIDDLHRAGKLPFLVGGTGQYITAIEDGWSIPEIAPDNALRDELERVAATEGAQALYARLVALDPDYAQRTHPNNVRRVIRALEVCLLSGSTMTALQQQKPVPYRLYRIGLTMERDALYQRADQRVHHMLDMGLMGEVEMLIERGYSPRLPSMTSIGYRELIAVQQGEMALSEAIQKIQFATHDFIRRQEIWFRGHDRGIMWHNMSEISLETLAAHLENWLSE
jgi:tRNA dimethylallyltransferase